MVQLQQQQKWASPTLSIWVTDVMSTGFNVITTAREPILNTQHPLVPLLTPSLLTKNITQSKTWHETYYCISLKKMVFNKPQDNNICKIKTTHTHTQNLNQEEMGAAC